MDQELRYGLWDAFHINLWEKLEYDLSGDFLLNSNLRLLFQMYWHEYFQATT